MRKAEGRTERKKEQKRGRMRKRKESEKQTNKDKTQERKDGMREESGKHPDCTEKEQRSSCSGPTQTYYHKYGAFLSSIKLF